MRQPTDGRTPGLGRSFIKGPRFFVKPSMQNCCEKCVWGSGEHSCGLPVNPAAIPAQPREREHQQNEK